MKTLILNIKNMRVEIDARVRGVESLEGSREVSLARTALQEGKMFLGLALRQLGEATPYPKGEDTQTREVDPSVDVAAAGSVVPGTDRVQAIKQLRAELAELLKTFDVGEALDPGAVHFKASRWMRESETALARARLWLGEALRVEAGKPEAGVSEAGVSAGSKAKEPEVGKPEARVSEEPTAKEPEAGVSEEPAAQTKAATNAAAGGDLLLSDEPAAYANKPKSEAKAKK